MHMAILPTANPNRTCHCSHDEMDNPRPNCQRVTVEEINTACENNDLQAFKAMSIHPSRAVLLVFPYHAKLMEFSELCLLA